MGGARVSGGGGPDFGPFAVGGFVGRGADLAGGGEDAEELFDFGGAEVQALGEGADGHAGGAGFGEESEEAIAEVGFFGDDGGGPDAMEARAPCFDDGEGAAEVRQLDGDGQGGRVHGGKKHGDLDGMGGQAAITAVEQLVDGAAEEHVVAGGAGVVLPGGGDTSGGRNVVTTVDVVVPSNGYVRLWG